MMSALHKLRVLLALDFRTQLLFIEALFYLGWARLLIRMKFTKVAPMLGAQMEETPVHIAEHHIHHLRDVAEAVNVVSQHTLWESKCLVRAIAALKMLARRNVESTLYLGTAKDEHNKLIAHAWLRSGPYYITGAAEKHMFTVVGKFAKRI